MAFFLFPVVCNLLNTLVEVSDDEFDIINEQFTPGIGILYGTFVALTLDILYERQGKVQENASVEASLLSQVTQNVISLFRDEVNIAREATQIIADQVRIIVYRSRGSEMLNIMRSDPYARLLSLIDHYQRDRKEFTPHQEALIDGLRGEIPALMEARAKRLSDEASALPPTHFLVLLLLTALSLIGFTAATLTITDDNGQPPLESRMVFAGLSAVYVLFFNFCNDMNDPFDGVYQIKRSSAASYLLQIKWLVASQPFGGDIRFDTKAAFAPEFDGMEVLEIGKGAVKIEPESLVVKELKSDASPLIEESTSDDSGVETQPEKIGLATQMEASEVTETHAQEIDLTIVSFDGVAANEDPETNDDTPDQPQSSEEDVESVLDFLEADNQVKATPEASEVEAVIPEKNMMVASEDSKPTGTASSSQSESSTLSTGNAHNEKVAKYFQILSGFGDRKAASQTPPPTN
ncbi:predicted protein [Thalassiosira pseudonana CCMP1335]|uniref:Uncharacterized protein n=1 Tax=Thalassiosira pseudonana TaxID=35128 RepID=B8C5Y8_THAPS|nr:predicted protein [Thalassiosira pseudonana CCMP1335]EED91590.1 predicted protein [Thalassiosira pseudonana CCMP1335]